MKTDDATLIARYQLGDRNALDALIQRHQAMAFVQAVRLTHDTEQAGDVVADAFLRVCKSLMNFQGKSSFTSWLYRIIMNCYLDARHRSVSRPAVSLDSCYVIDSGELLGDFREHGPGAQFEVERQAEALCLRNAINQLPMNQRSILELYYIYAMNYEEIAGRLKVPTGTVKSRLCRARMAMRALLEPDREMLIAA